MRGMSGKPRDSMSEAERTERRSKAGLGGARRIERSGAGRGRAGMRQAGAEWFGQGTTIHYDSQIMKTTVLDDSSETRMC